LALSMAVVAAALVGVRSPALRRAFRYAGLATLVAIGVSTTLELTIVRDLSSYAPDALAMVDWHMSYVFGTADQLASGGRLFGDVTPRIGLVAPVALAAWQRAFGSLSMGQLIHLSGLVNALFLLLTFALYARLSGGFRPPAVLGLLIALSWLHAQHASTLFPNQSAVRHLNFVLGPWGAYLLLRQPFPRAIRWIGPLCALLVLYNLETGAPLAVGVAVAFWVRHRSRLLTEHPARSALLRSLVGGSLATVTCAAALARVALGRWPAIPTPTRLFSTIASFASGYGGGWEPLAPFTVLLLGHSTWVLLNASASRNSMGARPAFRCAMATGILIWFAYYANRADPWNLWTLQVLYGYLALDLFRHARAIRRSNLALAGVVSVALLLFVIAPHAAAANAPELGRFFGVDFALPASQDSGTLVSAIRVRNDLALELTHRAAWLRSLPGPVVYVTPCPFLLSKLAGVRSAMPVGDAFFGVFSRAEYERLLAELTSADRILLDSPHTALGATPSHRRYFRRLRRDLAASGYSAVAVPGGWESWQRNSR
jgi:hypothetical protein